MATPTNLKTGTVDIGVNAYSKPVNTAAIEAVGTGMDLWAKESKRRFDKGYEQDVKNLRTLQESDPVVKDSIAASELINRQVVQGGLNEADSRTLKALEKDYDSLDILLEQGKQSWDMYRLRGSNLLRNAVMLRPDMGDELRSVAAKYLGVDVNNAYLEIWKEGQMRMENQTKGGKDDGGLTNATFKSYIEMSALDPDIMVQQSNQQIIRTAFQKWQDGDAAGAKAMLQTVSWQGDKNPAIAARTAFLDPTTQKDYADTQIRFSTMAKQSVLDKAAFEQEIPQLTVKRDQLLEWRNAIESDVSNLSKDKDALIARIDGFLTPINQLLSTDSDEERLNIIKNTTALAELRLKPTANAIISEINPYSPNVNADAAALVTDGVALSDPDSDEFAGYVPTSAYSMTRPQLNSAFSAVLIDTENSPKKAIPTTKALVYMMHPYAQSREMNGSKIVQSPQQMHNIVQILNSSNGELLARSEFLAKQAPELLALQVGLRYGMITEIQKSRFSNLPPELRPFVEIPDLGATYSQSRKGLTIEDVKFKISKEASPEQRARIVQWGKENPAALNNVAFTTFVNDTLTMAGRVQGVK